VNPGVIVVLLLVAWFVLAFVVAWIFGHMARVGSREEDDG
jgi:hypothetical protein